MPPTTSTPTSNSPAIPPSKNETSKAPTANYKYPPKSPGPITTSPPTSSLDLKTTKR